MNTLPEEIIINHILPYTYNLKDRNHLMDIRSFTSDLGILENVYWFEFKNITTNKAGNSLLIRLL